MGRKRRPTSPANPFYGYSAELIAAWCGVSVGTAEHYKAGRRKPPTPVLRLWTLYRENCVLGEDWAGHRVIGNKLFGPDGRHITPSDYALIGLLWQALAEKVPASYYALLDRKRQ